MSNTALAQPSAPRRSALITMASRLNVEEGSLLKTLKETVCKGCSDSEVMAFSVVANEYSLNPFIKQIYAFPAKGGGIVPVVSVDGWVTMVNNHPQMDGMEFEYHRTEAGKLEAVTCTLWRKDRNRPIKVTEILEECRRNTEPWKMENRMLRHKALMQCARYAFGFSGIYDEDEGEDMRDVTPRQTTGVNANPFKEDAPAKKAAPAITEAPVTETAVEVAFDRKAKLQELAAAVKASGRKNAEALTIFLEAGLLGPDAKAISDATDEQIEGMLAALHLLEKAEEPAPEPVATPTAKEAWLDRIEELGLEQEPALKLHQIEALCRKVGVLTPTGTLKAAKEEKLASIHANFHAILEKAGKEEA